MKLKTYIFLCITILIVKFTIVSNLSNDNYNYISFLDIGQGDAVLLNLGGRKFLVDGGPGFDVDRYINKYSLSTNCEIDAIFLTHAHSDHESGLARLAERCKINKIYVNTVEYFLYGGENIKELLPLAAGDVVKLSKDITLHVLWPPADDIHRNYFSNPNNTSLVLLLDAGDFEVMLTGDLEKEMYSKINPSQHTDVVEWPLEIYKAAHHGAANGYSEEFVKSLRPKICVVSVGEDNKYGHPNNDVLKAMSNLGCEVKRTDELGSIVLSIEI